MSIDNLRSALLPSYAKDMSLNLSLPCPTWQYSPSSSSGAQSSLTCSSKPRLTLLLLEIAAEAKEHLSDTAYEAARCCIHHGHEQHLLPHPWLP